MVFQINEKRAVITGAASGIGLAVARLFARAGASVILCDLDTAAVTARAQEVAAETAAEARGIAFDVSNEDAVQKGFEHIGGDPIDILVNCAGVAHVGRLESTALVDFDRLYSINVRGTFLCMRAALPRLIAGGGGSIVNLASIAATSGLSDRFAYSMTKGAVVAMTLSVARDYLAAGVRCNSISPARVHTPFVDGFLAKNFPGQEADKMRELARAQPIGRMGEPEEIAAMALYLCSDEAAFVTGADYLIDGGFTNLR
jgi:NAD(P)-dependent dehydrogenase (short-subunit alcohol dehydrogenase family)